VATGVAIVWSICEMIKPMLLLSSADVEKKQHTGVGSSPAVALPMAKGCKTHFFELKGPFGHTGEDAQVRIFCCRPIADLPRRKKIRIFRQLYC
jgi:hypothetical protein